MRIRFNSTCFDAKYLVQELRERGRDKEWKTDKRRSRSQRGISPKYRSSSLEKLKDLGGVQTQSFISEIQWQRLVQISFTAFRYYQFVF